MKDLSPLKKHIQEAPKIAELRAKRKKARKRIRVLFGIFFVTLLGAGVFFAYYPPLQIVSITVSGNQIVRSEDIVAVTQGVLSGSYYHIVPHRNTAFYPKQKIVEALASAYPRLKDITIYRVGHTALSIVVTERRGYALWCGSDITIPNEKLTCYFTDDEGKLISQAPQYSGNVYARFFGGSLSSSDSSLTGQTFIPQQQFADLLAFQNRIADLGFQVKAIDVTHSDEYQFVLDLGNQKTAIIRFLPDTDYGVLADNLALALSKKELIDQIKKNKAGLQYFDLRFSNKVYYKFQ